MFSRLYVLIQENLANFNIEGIYTEEEVNKRKTYLNNICPFNKYVITGPFIINSNAQNNIFKRHNTNQFMTPNNTFDQNTNQFMTPNNTFNQNTNQFMTPNNTFNQNTNQFMTANNTFNQNTNQFMNPNNTFNQNPSQFMNPNNNYSKQSKFKINDMNIDMDIE
jgi:hypothetical protein